MCNVYDSFTLVNFTFLNKEIIYIIKPFAHIYINMYICYINIYMYMLAIADQTAGPNGLNFFEKAYGYPGGNTDKIN